MARIALFFSVVFFQTWAWAAPHVVTALVHSDQTYVLDQGGQSLQEYGVGDTIYLLMDISKKKKGFYRVTFDPTNLEGDGWVSETKVRVLSNYKSTDGKLPKEYDKKYVEKEPPLQTQSEEDLLSGEITFIEELVSKEQEVLNNEVAKPKQAQPSTVVSTNGKNPFEEDLEFLFTEDNEFKETFQSAKNEHFTQGVSKIGISSFSLKGDQFATDVRSKFKNNLNAEMSFNQVFDISYVQNIETTDEVNKVNMPGEVSGIFFGVLSSKIGKNRLFKIKYYDVALKQFIFEKVVNLPLDQSVDPSLNTLVTEAATFLRSQQ
ncbi:MAG: hypothetical protein KDD46_07420 [Bdellovibrionales bacterium]|nr:hypothetical protein [Bdellovibrionales bacterium]